MNRRKDVLRSVEDYTRFRAALEHAVKPEAAEEDIVQSFDDFPDENRIGLTDSMMMHAGVSVSQIGLTLGIEAPTSLDQLHRRGETFLYASLGATALYAVIDATQQLI